MTDGGGANDANGDGAPMDDDYLARQQEIQMEIDRVEERNKQNRDRAFAMASAAAAQSQNAVTAAMKRQADPDALLAEDEQRQEVLRSRFGPPPPLPGEIIAKHVNGSGSSGNPTFINELNREVSALTCASSSAAALTGASSSAAAAAFPNVVDMETQTQHRARGSLGRRRRTKRLIPTGLGRCTDGPDARQDSLVRSAIVSDKTVGWRTDRTGRWRAPRTRRARTSPASRSVAARRRPRAPVPASGSRTRSGGAKAGRPGA